MKDLEDLAMEDKFWGVYDNNKRNIMLQNTMYDEGVSDGIEQGENKRNIEIAKCMKENGEKMETISKYTGLSLDDIEKI